MIDTVAWSVASLFYRPLMPTYLTGQYPMDYAAHRISFLIVPYLAPLAAKGRTGMRIRLGLHSRCAHVFSTLRENLPRLTPPVRERGTAVADSVCDSPLRATLPPCHACLSEVYPFGVVPVAAGAVPARYSM